MNSLKLTRMYIKNDLRKVYPDKEFMVDITEFQDGSQTVEVKRSYGPETKDVEAIIDKHKGNLDNYYYERIVPVYD